MKQTVLALALSGACIVAAGPAYANQAVNIQNLTRNGTSVAAAGPVFVASGDVLKFDAVLTENGPTGITTGLGLCLEYASTVLSDPVLSSILDDGMLVGQGTPDSVQNCFTDPSVAPPGSVQVPGSDRAVITPWASLFTGNMFPSKTAGLPFKLYSAQANVVGKPAPTGAVGFAAKRVSSGETFTTLGPLLLCAKPTVSVTTTANGVEAGSIPATISIALSSPIPAACGGAAGFPVTLNLSGTATLPGQSGADYAVGGAQIALSGSVVTATFPANGTTQSLTFTATPVADNNTEPVETVVLTVAPGSGNYVGAGASATATIADTAPVQTVVEYLDTKDFPSSPGGHFFYSSDPAEQAAVDSGAAGSFNRTGRTFKTGGTSPVCRFYGSVNPGPNSHFFTVSADECNALKGLQQTPTPSNVQQWNFERIEYTTTPPTMVGNTATCAAGTVPIYRAYNNAFPLTGPKNPWDSNHRYTPNHADLEPLLALGWRDEGIQFCTPQ